MEQQQLRALLDAAVVHGDAKASSSLVDMQAQPGTAALLLQHAVSVIEQRATRCLAALLLKETLRRYWRPAEPSGKSAAPEQPLGPSEEERAYLRRTMLDAVLVDDTQLAVLLTDALTTAAAVDIPRGQWPDLVPSIVSMVVHAQERVPLRRAVMLCYYTLRTLAVKPSGRACLFHVLDDLLHRIAPLWQQQTQLMLQGDEDAGYLARYSGKIMRVLTCQVAKSFDDQHIVWYLSQGLLGAIDALWDAVAACDVSSARYTELRKNLHHSLKTLLRLSKPDTQRMQRFSPYLPSYFRLFVARVVSGASPSSRVTLQSLRFLDNLIRGSYVEESSGSLSRRQANAMALQALFDADTVKSLVTAVISHHVVLTEEDVAAWDAEPEQFLVEDEADYNSSVRACAMMLYGTLLDRFPDQAGAVVLDLFAAVAMHPLTAAETPLRDVFSKEAVYHLVSQGAYELSEALDPHLGQWLQQSLVPEAATTCAVLRPLRRRIAVVLHQWQTFLPHGSAPVVYQVLSHLLDDPDGDVCTQYAAALAFGTALADAVRVSELEPLAPFTGNVMLRLIHLLGRLQQRSFQQQVLTVLTSLIDNARQQVVPMLSDVVYALMVMWSRPADDDAVGATADENHAALMRATLLECMRAVVAATRTECTTLLPYVLPMLKQAMDLRPGSQAVHTLDKGVEVVREFVRCLPHAVPEVTELVALMQPLLTLDISIDCTDVISTFGGLVLLLGETDQLPSVLPTWLPGLSRMFTEVRARAQARVLDVVQTALQLAPAATADAADDLLARLVLLLVTPVSDPNDSIVVRQAVLVLARLLLHQADRFFHLLQRVSTQGDLAHAALASIAANTDLHRDPVWARYFAQAAPHQTPQQQVQYVVLSFMLGAVDTMFDPYEKKLVALCAAMLLPTPLIALGLLPQALAVLGEAVSDEDDTAGDNDGDDPSLCDAENRHPAMPASPTSVHMSPLDVGLPAERLRSRRLLQRDPVQTVPLRQAITDQLDAAAAAHGLDHVAAMLRSVDPFLVSALRLPSSLLRKLGVGEIASSA